MDRTYVTENNRERARLRALVDRLSHLLRDPVVRDWRGRNGMYHICKFCQKPTLFWATGPGVKHRED